MQINLFIPIFLLSERTLIFFFFFFNDTATTEIYTLSLHDALPISHELSVELPKEIAVARAHGDLSENAEYKFAKRSEEHTSELQSPCNLVCRLLLEKKKKKQILISEMREHDVNT